MRLNRRKAASGLLFSWLWLMGWPDPAIAADPAASNRFSYGGEIDFNSRYVWRGIPLSKGGVLQPDGWVTYGDFTFEAWGNQILAERNKRGEFDEATLIATWEYRRGPLSLAPSFTEFLLPNQPEEPDTGEAGLTLAYQAGPFALSTNHQFDVVEYKGSYYGSAGVEWAKPMGDQWRWTVPVSVAWANARFNDVNIGVPKAAWNAFTATLALTYQPAGWFYIRPHLDWNRLLDRRLRDAIGRTAFLEGGVAVGVEF